MTVADRLQIRRYDPARDNADALELERRSPQGEAFVLSFYRSAFHRRAENFDDHILLVAHLDGQLVGTNAAAFKDVTVNGEPMRSAFGFDLRVHPDHRRRGIATALAGAMDEEGAGKATMAYTWIVDDNRAIRALIERESSKPGRRGPARVAARYAYQVYPTYKPLQTEHVVATADGAEVLALHQMVHGPFGFNTDPTVGGALTERVGSWVAHQGGRVAACSAWDNRSILGEVVEALPLHLRAFGKALSLWPGRAPHVPEPGERLQSWYLYDWTADDPALAASLIRHVAGEARAQDIDFLYIIHQPFQREIIDAIRRDVPKPFAPRVPYAMFAGWESEEPFPDLDSVYVDVRDV